MLSYRAVYFSISDTQKVMLGSTLDTPDTYHYSDKVLVASTMRGEKKYRKLKLLRLGILWPLHLLPHRHAQPELSPYIPGIGRHEDRLWIE